ncbi:MAG: sulfotransferase [Chloroflexota bacterium]|nr:sulfotransferase [Chloroflexota bacterium]
MAQLIEQPIFVVGSPRSGTTLLRFILSSHPRIVIPDETGFIPFLGKDADEILTEAEAQGVLHRIGDLNRAWRDLVVDTSAFYAGLAEPRLTFLLDALYRLKAEPHGAARWGDKTPGYVRFIPALNRIFPTAQFIHVVRDGRDVTLSAKNKWGATRAYMDSYYLLRNWVRNVETGRAAGQLLGPDRYLEVHYESLVESPGPVAQKLCQFLGETFHPAMLDHTRESRKSTGKTTHVEVLQPISSASVQRWRNEMAPFDQKMAEQVAGETLEAFGYPVAPLDPLTASERARLSALAGKYLVSDTTQRMLYKMGILTLNRGKRS